MTFLAPGQRGGRRRRRLDEGEGEGNMSGWLVSQGDKVALQTVGVVGEPKKTSRRWSNEGLHLYRVSSPSSINVSTQYKCETNTFAASGATTWYKCEVCVPVGATAWDKCPASGSPPPHSVHMISFVPRTKILGINKKSTQGQIKCSIL
jgi:hypothetical protein